MQQLQVLADAVHQVLVCQNPKPYMAHSARCVDAATCSSCKCSSAPSTRSLSAALLTLHAQRALHRRGDVQ